MSSQNMSTYFTTIRVHTAVESRNKNFNAVSRTTMIFKH